MTLKDQIQGHSNAGISDWKNKTVGFGSDGASVMVGNRGGVCCLFQAEIPHLIGVHCTAHRLELAAMGVIKAEPQMTKITNLVYGMFKQYYYSANAWRELKAVAIALDEPFIKPSNLGGTRW